MGMLHLSLEYVSSLLSDKRVLAAINVLPQICSHPIGSNPTPFDLLFSLGARTQLDCWVFGMPLSLVFVMPVMDVCYACP